jgi:hypothetical protein
MGDRSKGVANTKRSGPPKKKFSKSWKIHGKIVHFGSFQTIPNIFKLLSLIDLVQFLRHLITSLYLKLIPIKMSC